MREDGLSTADRIKVLLIEDDARIRRSVRWSLEDAGMCVEAPEHRWDLRARSVANDVVVLDIAAAGSCDELTALEELALDGPIRPTVVLSAHGQPYLRSVAAALGAVAYLDRATTDADQLVAVVAEAAAAATVTGRPIRTR